MSSKYAGIIDYLEKTNYQDKFKEIIKLLNDDKTIKVLSKLKFMVTKNKEFNNLIYFTLGVIYEINGNIKEAKMWYTKANLLADAYYNLGVLIMGENKIGEAYLMYEKALELNDSHVGSLNNIAVCYSFLSDEKKKSISDISDVAHKSAKSIKLNQAASLNIDSDAPEESPLDSEIILNSISILKKKYDPKVELSFYKRIIDINPNNSHAHHNVGHLYNGLNEIELSQKHLEIAYRLDPKSAETCYTLAVLYNGHTLNNPLLLPAKTLFQISQVHYIKSINKKLTILKPDIKSDIIEWIPTEYDKLNEYKINNCIVSCGRIVTDTDIILTHHHLHVAAHRLSAKYVVEESYETAWSSLQHNSWGYYHWLCENLPRLLYILKIEKDYNVPILLPDKPFVKSFIAGLQSSNYGKIKHNIIYSKSVSSYLIKELKILDWENINDDFNNVFLPPKDVITFTRNQLDLKNINPKKHIIWLSREKVKTRHVSNELDIIEKLKEILNYRGYSIINYIPEKYSYIQTKDIFEKALVIVGVHGGALSNMIYSTNTNIIELTMMEDYYNRFFSHLSECCNHNYIPISINKPNLFKLSEFELPNDIVDQVLDTINSIITIK